MVLLPSPQLLRRDHAVAGAVHRRERDAHQRAVGGRDIPRFRLLPAYVLERGADVGE